MPPILPPVRRPGPRTTRGGIIPSPAGTFAGVPVSGGIGPPSHRSILDRLFMAAPHQHRLGQADLHAALGILGRAGMLPVHAFNAIMAKEGELNRFQALQEQIRNQVGHENSSSIAWQIQHGPYSAPIRRPGPVIERSVRR